MGYANDFVNFLNKCHSTYHAVKQMELELREAGFVKLKENAAWNLENNRFYYVVRDDSSIIAFKIPEILNVRSLNIVASHTDSPYLKIKPTAENPDKNYNKLNVEIYGGPILSTWLDRPLSIAGRVVVKENGLLASKLVDFDENMAIIPNVAIHQNPAANDGYKWNKVVDFLPMLGNDPEPNYLNKLLARKLNCDVEDIFAHDLNLYNRDKAIVWGDDTYISGGRIDNLESAYTSLQAFKNAYSAHSINIFASFDNEEVGAVTRDGMASKFLIDVIERIFASFYYNPIDVKPILANSFLISSDNAHAAHPNHPELYDAIDRVYMNKGVVIKSNASQRYIGDALGASILKLLCQRADVPCQTFVNRADNRGGSTQTGISSINLSILACDVGLPQLAMHSSFETCGFKDVEYMIKMMSEFYNSTVIIDEGKINIVK